MLFVYIVALSTSFLGSLISRNKCLGLFTGFLMLILASSMQVGYDTENYIKSFDTIARGTNLLVVSIADASMMYFMTVESFQDFGIQDFFFLFKFLILLISSFFVLRTINKFVSNWCLLFFLYLIGVFFDDAMQLRNTISLALLVCSFYYLYSNDRGSTLKYGLIIFLASLYHVTFLAYFLFLLAKSNKVKSIKCLFFVGLILYVFTFLKGDFFFISALQSMFGGDKIQLYLENDATQYGSLYVLVFYFAEYLIVKYCDLEIQKLDVRRDGSLYDMKRFSSIILGIITIMAISLPFCVLSLSAMRLLRNITIFILFEVVLFASIPVSRKKKYLIVTSTVFTMLYFMIFSNFITGPPEDIIFSIFNGDASWMKQYF